MRAMIGALDWSFYWLYEMPRAEAASVIGVLRDLFTFGLLAKPESNVSATDIASLPLAAEEQAFDRDTQNRRKQEAFLKAGTRCFNQKGFSGTWGRRASQARERRSAFVWGSFALQVFWICAVLEHADKVVSFPCPLDVHLLSPATTEVLSLHAAALFTDRLRGTR